MKPISKLLVANRGEIACRVFRAAGQLGIGTVAVYSDADREALHVAMADESIRIGPALAAESYLSIPAILEAARATGADAIHPGYGFLSENPSFAEACAQAGLIFVGPSAEAIRQLGNKAAAKRIALDAGVPCIKGYQGKNQEDQTLLAEARTVGFPLLIKAAAGGGGRGMRRVAKEQDLSASLVSARTEARNAFGSDEVILEQLVEKARHVEIQIIADAHGHCLSLGERDCSVQRRHQKIIEESPCPVMTDSLRRSMSEAARKLAKAAGYVNAGTVEFLVDQEGRFYFLEMNTRLQVEHPVTELVTGLDLVQWQLQVASGESLAAYPSDIALCGHAIEARVYAEDPSQGFLPQTGRVRVWREPVQPGIRVDHGLRSGSEITPYYDPMIAKIISYGADREEARQRLLSALRSTVLFGVKCNLGFLEEVLEHTQFAGGHATTTFLDSSDLLKPKDESTDILAVAVACTLLIEHASRTVPTSTRGWRSTGPASVPVRLQVNDKMIAVRAVHRGKDYTLSVNDQSLALTVGNITEDLISWTSAGHGQQARFFIDGDEVFIHLGGKTHSFRDVTYAPPVDVRAAQGGTVKSPTSGRVLRVPAEEGNSVKKGEILAVVEAMKMENHVLSPRDGLIESVHIKEGGQVDANQLLITLAEPTEPAA